MATLTHTWSSSVKVPGLPTLPTDDPIVVTGNVDNVLLIDVAAGQTAHIADLNIQKESIQSMVLEVSGGPATVSTNALNSSPPTGDSFSLVSKKSVGWHNQMDEALFPLPILEDITDIYIDNTDGTATVTFRGAFLCND